jgi:epoxyqueuosine reductase
MNASRCLSYWTIESRETASLVGREMSPCFFGCDRCQEACPHNGDGAASEVSLPSTEEFLAMRDEEFEERFGRTALSRAGLEKIKSNIKAARERLL